MITFKQYIKEANELKVNDIMIRSFLKSAISFSFLPNVVRDFNTKEVKDWRVQLEEILAHTYKKNKLADYDTALAFVRTLSDKEMILFLQKIMPFYWKRYGHGIDNREIKNKLKLYKTKRKRKKKVKNEDV
jgi:hypothetical protein